MEGLGVARRSFFALVGAVVFGVMAAPAHGAFTATLTGTTATFAGDAAPFDFLTISRDSGELRHNLVGGGFNSSADFDTAVGGDQALPDTAAAHVIVNGGGGLDRVDLGSAGAVFQAAFTFDGGGGTDFLIAYGTGGADTVTLNGGAITGLASGPVSYTALEQVNVSTAGDADVVNLDATTGSTQTLVYGQEGNDTLRLANGALLTGGVFRGGVGTDTLDYSAWTAPVSVDLGKTARFTASLNGANEVPPNGSTATGFGLIEFTDLATNTFSYELDADGLTAAQITDSHIHAGAAGVIGGVIFPIGPGSGWTDPATPFTEGMNQTDPDITEPLLRGGNTYFNIHTGTFPIGEIRAQLTLHPDDGYGGTATGTSGNGARTVENVIGGSGPDVLRGSLLPNVLEGRGGADTLVGGEGADTLDCGDGQDSVTSDPTDTLIACDTDPGGGPGPGGGDTAAPETQITKSPKRKTTKRKAKFEFTSSEAGSSFTCVLDGKTSACTSPFTKKVKPGKHRFEVAASDATGNKDATAATFKWKVRRPR